MFVPRAGPTISRSQLACATPFGERLAEDREADLAVAEHVEVALGQIDPNDAVTEGEVLDLVKRTPKLEHTRRRVEVRPICVRLRENAGALSNVMDRSVIDRVDDRVRPVAPVDAARSVNGQNYVEALGGLDALKANHRCSDERPREARTTVVRYGLEG
jgi:hypothetical protein